MAGTVSGPFTVYTPPGRNTVPPPSNRTSLIADWIAARLSTFGLFGTAPKRVSVATASATTTSFFGEWGRDDTWRGDVDGRRGEVHDVEVGVEAEHLDGQHVRGPGGEMYRRHEERVRPGAPDAR